MGLDVLPDWVETDAMDGVWRNAGEDDGHTMPGIAGSESVASDGQL